MAIIKGKSDGGSGGKRGHSNMNHWMHTEEIKSAARKARRLEAKEVINAEVADHSKGRELLHCGRCGASWELTHHLSMSTRRAVVALVHADQRMEAISRLHSAGLDWPASKATVYHIPNASRNCHCCSTVLLGAEQLGTCPRCKALNIGW